MPFDCRYERCPFPRSLDSADEAIAALKAK
jgi:hypothetical protein